MAAEQKCELGAKKCVPCQGDATALSSGEIEALLASVPGWTLVKDGKAIERRFVFKNFAKALAFVNEVGGVAEAERHHPDISFGWGYAHCLLWTHAIGGLHENDFIMASKINILTN